tara:strand:+ start:42 stop:266 length:225 start_codon:yes stop_codon:yes gene_type:complete
MSKHLNNDQMIKKANKDVRDLGMIASTVLTIEIQSLVKRRINELKDDGTNINLVNPNTIIKVLETYLTPFNPNL